jgi:2-polyprenyl-3-methyl-5-hydroxy-6-metoxy-1,4-benzoquinol methylase
MFGISPQRSRHAAAYHWLGVARETFTLPAGSKSANRSLVDTLKIRYRPLICPFQDLFPYVRPGDRVCDLGCGSGLFPLLLRRFTRAKKILGIEISQRLVVNARELCRTQRSTIPVDFRLYNGIDFPEAIGQCNVVFLVDVLHHIPEARQQLFLQRLHDSMTPGSRLVVKDIDRDSPFVSTSCTTSSSQARWGGNGAFTMREPCASTPGSAS